MVKYVQLTPEVTFSCMLFPQSTDFTLRGGPVPPQRSSINRLRVMGYVNGNTSLTGFDSMITGRHEAEIET